MFSKNLEPDYGDLNLIRDVRRVLVKEYDIFNLLNGNYVYSKSAVKACDDIHQKALNK